MSSGEIFEQGAQDLLQQVTEKWGDRPPFDFADMASRLVELCRPLGHEIGGRGVTPWERAAAVALTLCIDPGERVINFHPHSEAARNLADLMQMIYVIGGYDMEGAVIDAGLAKEEDLSQISDDRNHAGWARWHLKTPESPAR